MIEMKLRDGTMISFRMGDQIKERSLCNKFKDGLEPGFQLNLGAKGKFKVEDIQSMSCVLEGGTVINEKKNDPNAKLRDQINRAMGSMQNQQEERVGKFIKLVEDGLGYVPYQNSTFQHALQNAKEDHSGVKIPIYANIVIASIKGR